MTTQLESEEKPKEETRAIVPIARAIAKHPFFAGLKPDHLQALTDSAMRMSYQEGECIFAESDPANRFYLIESGAVSLESHRRDESTVCIETIGPGEVLGWSWLFPPYYWHFDAYALKPTTAIFFYGTRLREQCEEDHDLGYELLKRISAVVIKRLQATRTRLLEAQR
jgi:CRP/FNR family cyclic AMP-dependent transcriptional regulator